MIGLVIYRIQQISYICTLPIIFSSFRDRMASSHRYFEGKSHAAAYAAYRPAPPASLIEKIVNNIR